MNHGKINLEKANKIRELYAEGGHSQEDLAARYGVGREYIGKILRNERHIDSDWSRDGNAEIVRLNRGDKLTEKMARDIRAMYKTGGYTHVQLAEKFGVEASSIGSVIRNETYRDDEWNPACVEDVKCFNCVTSKMGEGSSSASLSQEEVDELRKIYLTNKYTQAELAEMFGIGMSAVHFALHNKSYKSDNWDVDRMRYCAKKNNPKGEGHGMAKLTESEVLQIRRLYKRGLYTQDELGRMFKVTGTQIGRIVRLQGWKHL